MKRHKHNLSHYKLGSASMGKIYPISCYEGLPGDTIQQHTSIFIRATPMLAPVMHPVRVGVYTFMVPLRLLWKDSEEFLTGGPDGLDVTVPPAFKFTSGVARGSLADYLGVPLYFSDEVSSLPFRAYWRIYNEYFRDQDLCPENPVGLDTSSGLSTPSSLTGFDVANAPWEKDYFTTCRPWPQKGAEVSVPVEGLGSGTVSITSNGQPVKVSLQNVGYPEMTADNKNLRVTATYPAGGGNPSFSALQAAGVISSAFPGPDDSPSEEGATYANVKFGNSTGLTGTISGLSNNAKVRLDALREAFALQRFQEHRAMYGSRYTEYLRYLGIRSSDARLQRPEYLGGGKATLQFSEIMQTALDGDNPVGTLRGHGIGLVRTKAFRRFIEENCLILTLMVVRPIAIYSAGLSRMWTRKTKEEYWQRELEHIGQQEVMTRELYSGADADTLFGYQNMYDDYRSVPSSVCGEMRQLYDYWHMARTFANEPVLNQSFVEGAPTKRIFAEQNHDSLLFMAQQSIVARRILSKQGNPIL